MVRGLTSVLAFDFMASILIDDESSSSCLVDRRRALPTPLVLTAFAHRHAPPRAPIRETQALRSRDVRTACEPRAPARDDLSAIALPLGPEPATAAGARR